MKKLRVFRVQPESYNRVATSATQEKNRSEHLRRLIHRACEAPPSQFPARRIKADLRAFSLFMAEDEHSELVKASRAAGVSKNLFLEAAFNQLAGTAQVHVQ
jgi:hypothetical protein